MSTLLWDYPAAACVFFGSALVPAAGRQAGFSLLPGRGSRLETEFIGFAGRRARTMPPPGSYFPHLPARGSRPETEFIGFAGRRARTLPPPGSHFPLLPVRGSRPETEFIGFAGRRARTGSRWTWKKRLN